MSETNAQIDDVIKQAMADLGVPGLALGVTRREKQPACRGYGLANAPVARPHEITTPVEDTL